MRRRRRRCWPQMKEVSKGEEEPGEADEERKETSSEATLDNIVITIFTLVFIIFNSIFTCRRPILKRSCLVRHFNLLQFLLFLLFQILQMSTIVLFYKIYFICFNFGKVKDNWDIEPWTLRAPWQRVDIPTWEGRGGAWGWRSGWWRARRASRGWPSAWTSRNEPSLLSFFCFGQNFIFLSLRNAHVQTLIDRFKITHKSIPVWTWEICQYENSDVLGQLISMKAN